MAHSNYKAKRESNMFNALVHHITAEVNKANGSERAAQSHRRGRRGLLKELNEYCKTKLNGVRCNNATANLDFQATVTCIGAEIMNFYLIGDVAFFIPGHINDTIFPTWVHSNNSAQFIADEFKMSPGEFAQRLEKWATGQDTRPKHTSKLVTLQKECVVMIVEGLCNITGCKELRMSYGKFDTNIQLAHKVQICGWPTSVKFISPYEVTVISDVCLLHNALKGGECGWVEMSTHEHNDLKQMLKGKASTEKGTKKRKRGSNDENIDPSGRPPTKKARK
ncbi:hypothetical protein P691DRAFT_786547, partial [Macrolepiota fuliginosa MF-IS2]